MDAELYARIFAIEEHYWWSVGTRRIFRDWLRPAVGGHPPQILDVGCGSGMLARELTAIGSITGVDWSAEAIGFSRRRGLTHLCVGAAERLPFKSGWFDAVAAVDVVEHTDDHETLGEIVRVLKPGGVALLHVPAFPLLWGDHDEAAHHRRRYRRMPLRQVIEASGLRIERLSHINCFLFPVAASVRLAKRVLRRRRAHATPEAEIYNLPGWLNGALTRLLQMEQGLLRWTNLPFGVSLLCLARKSDGRP